MTPDHKRDLRLQALSDRGWAGLDAKFEDIKRLAAEKATYADTPDDDLTALVLAFVAGELGRRRKERERADEPHDVPRGPHFHGDRGEEQPQ